MRLRAAGAALAAIAVGLGAFGAHGLRERLAATPEAAEWWRTATLYLLVHAAAAAALPADRRGPQVCLVAGAMVFAGTLYAMALGAPRWLGAITPVGGILMVAGWAWLSLASLRSRIS